MAFADDPIRMWSCVTDPSVYHEEIVRARGRLADAARDAQWEKVFVLLNEVEPEHVLGGVDVNDVRVGGRSGFAPLHRAAWHGANPSVVDGLLDRGAWRSLRSSSGETPEEVARRRGHDRLADRVRAPSQADDDALHDIETLFAALITVETRLVVPGMRMPQLGPLVDEPERKFYCEIPGMFGGVYYLWGDARRNDTLLVNFSSRMDADSGTHYVVTPRSIDGVDANSEEARAMRRI